MQALAKKIASIPRICNQLHAEYLLLSLEIQNFPTEKHTEQIGFPFIEEVKLMALFSYPILHSVPFLERSKRWWRKLVCLIVHPKVVIILVHPCLGL